MKHEAEIQIVKRISKKGEEYTKLEIYVKGLMIADFYVKDSLQQILEYVMSSEVKKTQ